MLASPLPKSAGSIIILLLLVIFSCSVVRSADTHDQVCPVTSNGMTCDNDLLPIEGRSAVQDMALTRIRGWLIKGFTQGPAEYCSKKNWYNTVPNKYIGLYSYAYCSQTNAKECKDCLVGLAKFVKESCPGSNRVQAALGGCCIRYERDPFCFNA